MIIDLSRNEVDTLKEALQWLFSNAPPPKALGMRAGMLLLRLEARDAVRSELHTQLDALRSSSVSTWNNGA